MTSEPTTEAGRSMLYDWQKRRTHPLTDARQEAYRTFILAIEAEARAAAEREVVALVSAAKAVIDTFYGPEKPYYGHEMAALRDALKALANPAAAEPAP